MASPKTPPPTDTDFLNLPEVIFFVDALNAVMGIDKSLTGQKLAELSGVSPQTISLIQNRRANVAMHNIVRILLNLPPESQDMLFDILSQWPGKEKSLSSDPRRLIAVATAQAIQDRLAAA